LSRASMQKVVEDHVHDIVVSSVRSLSHEWPEFVVVPTSASLILVGL
jgi:hypothetical protein